MRIECPECDELVTVAQFICVRDPDRLRFECPACEVEVTVTSARSEDKPEDKDSDAIPDVGTLESDGSVTDVVLQQLWELVTDDFSEGARHDAFIAASEAQNKLAFAAARYREWLVDHAEDSVAVKRQKQILTLAQVRALAVSSRGKNEKDPLRKALMTLLLMVVFLGLVIVAAPILLKGARGCRATQSGQPGQSQLRRPRLPMVNNLRRRGRNRQGPRGLTPRRYRRGGSQLRNLKPPPRPGARRPAPMRPAPMRPAPMRPAPMRPAPMRIAPRRPLPMPAVSMRRGRQ